MSTALKWKIFVTPGHKRNRPAQVLWLQHRRHHFFRGRYRTLLHDGSCDLAGHETACPEAVAALVHIERMRESQDRVLGRGIGRPGHLGDDSAGP